MITCVTGDGYVVVSKGRVENHSCRVDMNVEVGLFSFTWDDMIAWLKRAVSEESIPRISTVSMTWSAASAETSDLKALSSVPGLRRVLSSSS
jgi:hypothetical protein